jgi:hypothetical protein
VATSSSPPCLGIAADRRDGSHVLAELSHPVTAEDTDTDYRYDVSLPQTEVPDRDARPAGIGRHLGGSSSIRHL